MDYLRRFLFSGSFGVFLHGHSTTQPTFIVHHASEATIPSFSSSTDLSATTIASSDTSSTISTPQVRPTRAGFLPSILFRRQRPSCPTIPEDKDIEARKKAFKRKRRKEHRMWIKVEKLYCRWVSADNHYNSLCTQRDKLGVQIRKADHDRRNAALSVERHEKRANDGGHVDVGGGGDFRQNIYQERYDTQRYVNELVDEKKKVDRKIERVGRRRERLGKKRADLQVVYDRLVAEVEVLRSALLH
ncbi:hypothetical protein F5Y16DRAFT_394196 [Xylariaceae sp. FL0255]|nr:hypothetical protein F5Y16DRAFT_394196 [Xylariaceae sp. FL0255]